MVHYYHPCQLHKKAPCATPAAHSFPQHTLYPSPAVCLPKATGQSSVRQQSHKRTAGSVERSDCAQCGINCCIFSRQPPYSCPWHRRRSQDPPCCWDAVRCSCDDVTIPTRAVNQQHIPILNLPLLVCTACACTLCAVQHLVNVVTDDALAGKLCLHVAIAALSSFRTATNQHRMDCCVSDGHHHLLAILCHEHVQLPTWSQHMNRSTPC